LRRCVNIVPATSSLAPAAHALLAQTLFQLGSPAEALAASLAERAHFTDRMELLFIEGEARQSLGDVVAAENCSRQLLASANPPPANLLDAAIPMKARHNLASLAFFAGRWDEADSLWTAVLAEDPNFTPAWLGRADVCAHRGSIEDRAALLDSLAADPRQRLTSSLVAARLHQLSNEIEQARTILEEACAQHPRSLEPRLTLARLLLRQAADWAAAERALRAVLELAPNHPEARQNLETLYHHGLVPRPASQER